MTNYSHYRLAANGIRFHIATPEPQGNGALVVLLHGFPNSGTPGVTSSPAQRRRLSRHRPDLRGYNDSESARGYDILTLTNDIAAIVKALRYSRAHIVGHDWGGVLAWTFAARFPNMTSKLVVMNAPHIAAYQRELRRNLAQWRKSWYVYFSRSPACPKPCSPVTTAPVSHACSSAPPNPTTFSPEDLARYADAFLQTRRRHRRAQLVSHRRPPAPHPATQSRPRRCSHPPPLGRPGHRPRPQPHLGLERWVPQPHRPHSPPRQPLVQQDAPEQVNRYLLDFPAQRPAPQPPIIPRCQQIKALNHDRHRWPDQNFYQQQKKTHTDITAVENLSLTVNEGEVFGFWGPNGAGKTTTVRLLACLIAPTRPGPPSPASHHPPAPRLRPDRHLTEAPGHTNASAPSTTWRFSPAFTTPLMSRARSRKYLRLLDLWDRRTAAAGTLSKGMKQKLAIALLHEPPVLFLDEPTSGLDPKPPGPCATSSKPQRAGRTIFICTHNLDEAERLCDRIAIFASASSRSAPKEALRRPSRSAARPSVQAPPRPTPPNLAALLQAL
ncbi:alpha/beta fold hydrolase, partial [Candidatus Amarolinea dominans]|uniref:alpha/beta fold hydrolase n=1 Tax=Candidatus Amarolinea dominans TaxID=3140696 RepID=UPI00313641A6|nr:alpha/beta fold hydrolase [Anaerolineae bacterium]